MSTNQEFLRTAVLKIFHKALNNEGISLENLNKAVYQHNESEIIERDIEWTWQHLIANTRKYLVDANLLKRYTDNGITLYTLIT